MAFVLLQKVKPQLWSIRSIRRRALQTFNVGPVSSASNRKSIYSSNGSIISYNSCNHNKAFEVDLAKEETFDAVANATEKSSKKLSIGKK